MKHTMIRAVLAALVLLAPACSDNGISFPTGDGGWQIGITAGVIPPRIDDVPVLISIQADIINLTNGERPSDGAAVVFTSTGGTFTNDLTEIELATTGGRVVTELEISLPGTYEVTVVYPQQDCTAVFGFSIGLE